MENSELSLVLGVGIRQYIKTLDERRMEPQLKITITRTLLPLMLIVLSQANHY